MKLATDVYIFIDQIDFKQKIDYCKNAIKYSLVFESQVS